MSGSATGPVSVRVGRQELVYGEQRLVGHVGWANAARTFDAARVTLRTKMFSVDAFGASVVRTLVDEFDKSGAGNRFAGAYATTQKLIPQATVEPYVFWKRDVNLRGELGTVANLQHSTVGVRLAGKMPARLDYGVEMAIQRGSLGSEDVEAWAGHWQLRESLPGRGAVKLTGEYNFASGDEDPADGVRGTFDQLYPTPHDKTGLADQIGWKNIRHARAGVRIHAGQGTADRHQLSLLVAGGTARRRLQRRQCRASAGCRPARPTRTSARKSTSRSRARSRRISPSPRGYAHIAPGAFLEDGHTRRLLQPSLRHGHVCLPCGEVR